MYALQHRLPSAQT